MPTKPEDLSADLDGSNRQGDPCTWWLGQEIPRQVSCC
jgi:hypothetical protein